MGVLDKEEKQTKIPKSFYCCFSSTEQMTAQRERIIDKIKVIIT